MALSKFIANTLATLWMVLVGYLEYAQHGTAYQPVVKSWCFCFAGFVMFVSAEEFAQYTGRYGVSRDHFYTQPAWYIRGVGFLAFIIFSFSLVLD